MESSKLSHITNDNNPGMVAVGDKGITHRIARASATVILPQDLISLIENDELQSPKGPVFQTAIIAGTMGCKKTSELIPFCHPLSLEDCKITITVNENSGIVIDCKVSVHHKTGVEMEALTGATVAALTIYDMCKSMSHDIVIHNTHLVEKSGGKSDYHHLVHCKA